MQNATLTSLVASKPHYKCLKMQFHLVFIRVCQINGSLENPHQHEMGIMEMQVFAGHASFDRFSIDVTSDCVTACQPFSGLSCLVGLTIRIPAFDVWFNVMRISLRLAMWVSVE